MTSTIDIHPRAQVGQAGVGLVVVVVFVGIAFGAGVLSLVFGIVFATALAVRAVHMRVRVQGDRLFVRNFTTRAKLQKAEVTEFVVAEVTGPWKVPLRRRVVDLGLRDGRWLRLTATARPERNPKPAVGIPVPNEADDLAAELNAWLHEPEQEEAAGA